MKILKYSNENINLILKSRSKSATVQEVVIPIIENVKAKGDKYLLELAEKFDKANLTNLKVSKAEIKKAYASVTKQEIAALKFAYKNIYKFHTDCLTKKSKITETVPGVKVWREFRAIPKVGLYAPGGTASYPSTVLMLGIPAFIAKCQEVILCTPVNTKGECNPLVLVAADICKISNIYKVGGAQAIAAMAYGTETISKVDKIFGPGNQFVSTAKEIVQKDVAIDMPAGPSEVLVLADDSANPKFIAADLLSQLEHGKDSQAVLVCQNLVLAEKVQQEIISQMEKLNRKEIISESLKISYALITNNDQESIEFINQYAPEHLEIITQKDSDLLSKINNFGSAFIGQYSSEPLGDYVTGTNHTLPTAGYCKSYSPLSIESFGKMVQIQKVSKTGFLNCYKQASILAESEQLDAHKQALEIRIN